MVTVALAAMTRYLCLLPNINFVRPLWPFCQYFRIIYPTLVLIRGRTGVCLWRAVPQALLRTVRGVGEKVVDRALRPDGGEREVIIKSAICYKACQVYTQDSEQATELPREDEGQGSPGYIPSMRNRHSSGGFLHFS